MCFRFRRNGHKLTSNCQIWGNGADQYEGPLLVTLQLDGGADVTQLCDPKTNTPGELKINHWADTDEVQQIGNLQFAPVANNAELFNRYGKDTLVINGVDSQTNSHDTGRLYNWTGSNAEGKPLSLPCMPPIMRPISRWPIRFMAGSLVPQE